MPAGESPKPSQSAKPLYESKPALATIPALLVIHRPGRLSWCRQGGIMKVIYLEDLSVGDSWESSEHVVDGAEMLAYNQQNDPWPMHVDPEAAAKTPYGGVIASGGYTISILLRLGHEIYNRPDLRWAFLGGIGWHLKFVEPVRAGDRLRERITILEARPSSKPGRGITKIRMELVKNPGGVALSVDSVGMMAARPEATSS